jgi:citronellol/citronellal dehydrogenase
VQRLDVDTWDLHEPVVPGNRRLLTRAVDARVAMRRSEDFAGGALAGRAVLVTGGGTGLGRAAVAQLRRCGAQVVICGRRPDVPAATRASWISTTSPATSARMPTVRFALERCGRLEALVNNAGGQYFTPAEAIEPKG